MAALPVETPAAWLRFAEENLSVAQREMVHALPAFRTVCFLCQSAAEKYLKGYLISQGWTLEKTHDIVVLLGLCANYHQEFSQLLEAGAIINEYIVAGRYPGDLTLEIIDRPEAEEALEIVAQIRNVVLSLLEF
jgi:HEPN domain-containing protein